MYLDEMILEEVFKLKHAILITKMMDLLMRLFSNTFLKIPLIISLLSIGLFGAPSGVYIELSAGMSLDDVQETKNANYVYERGYIGSLALGYQVDTFRVELQQRYKKDDLYSANIGNGSSIKVNGNLVTNSQMLNLYYSGYNSSKLITSVGLGAGVTSLKLGEDLNDDTILSLQAMLSVGYQISESFIATSKYTYFYTSKSKSFKANGDNALTFSLRYIF